MEREVKAQGETIKYYQIKFIVMVFYLYVLIVIGFLILIYFGSVQQQIYNLLKYKYPNKYEEIGEPSALKFRNKALLKIVFNKVKLPTDPELIKFVKWCKILYFTSILLGIIFLMILILFLLR